jgi:hypothetical protein
LTSVNPAHERPKQEAYEFQASLGSIVILRPPRTKERIPAQPGLHSKTLSQKKFLIKQINNNNKKP